MNKGRVEKVKGKLWFIYNYVYNVYIVFVYTCVCMLWVCI